MPLRVRDQERTELQIAFMLIGGLCIRLISAFVCEDGHQKKLMRVAVTLKIIVGNPAIDERIPQIIHGFYELIGCARADMKVCNGSIHNDLLFQAETPSRANLCASATYPCVPAYTCQKEFHD